MRRKKLPDGNVYEYVIFGLGKTNFFLYRINDSHCKNCNLKTARNGDNIWVYKVTVYYRDLNWSMF